MKLRVLQHGGTAPYIHGHAAARDDGHSHHARSSTGASAVHVKGFPAKDLSIALPSVCRPAEAGLPSFMPNEDMQRALSSCDPNTDTH